MKMRKAIWLTVAVICAAATAGLQLSCKATDEIPGRAATTRPSNAASAKPAAAADASATPHGSAGAQEVRRITIAELQEALKRDEAIVVDVRSQSAYDAGHIKDSISVPEGEIDRHLSELPKDKLIVTYCA